MTHKIVTLRKRKKDGHDSPYVTTDIPFGRSLTEIKDMLRRYGCEKILTFEEVVGSIPAHSLAFDFKGTKFLIEFPITYLANPNGSGKALNMNVSGRIIYYKVKALLIDVELNHLDFNQAMVPFMLLPTASGRPTTVTDILTIRDVNERSRGVQFMLGNGK